MKKKKKEKPDESAAAAAGDSAENPHSELNDAIWSVITFDDCAASGLRYGEAVELLERLKTEKISGLCIVTDQAAAGMTAKKK